MLRLLYPFDHFSDFLISYSWEFRQLHVYLTIFKLIDISHRFYDLVIDQDIDHAFADALDIHAVLADEMDYLLLHFLRAMRVGAVIMDIYIRDRLMA